MTARLALVLLLFGLFGDEGAEHGRTGNALYEQGEYAAAETAYRDGLAAHADTTGAVYAALQNNLGATLHRQERFSEARAAFQTALRAAPTPTARTRALFNAATAAAGMGRLEAALAEYRQVLLQDPDHKRARYNYEYLKRQLRQGRSGGGAPPDVEPSPYARRMKTEAEALVRRREYAAAVRTMEQALRADSTVAAYQDFMARLDAVAKIADTP
jgi:tetratricopeptide (TPR) repeat protein